MKALQPKPRILLFALPALLPASCTDTVDTADLVPALQLEELARIDGAAAGQGFGRIADIEIGPDGAVYVLDGLERNVRVFDEDGAPLRTFGSQGGGPGEFERPAALAWGPDGNLWVADAGAGRLTEFETAGDVVGTYPYPGFHPLAIGFAPDGRLIAVLSGFDLMQPQAILYEAEPADGELIERGRTELDFVQWPTNFVREGGGMIEVLEAPFASAPVFRIGPAGQLWYADTGAPLVQRRSAVGAIAQTYGREFDAPLVTDADRQAVLGSEDVERLRSQHGAAAVAEYTDLIPDTRPHLRGFFIDDASNVWIMRAGQESGDPDLLDVYSADGGLIAAGTADFAAAPHPRVRGSLLAAVVRDELGEEAVLLYRVGW